MKFEELERQVGILTPGLSTEGRMLVGLFMPFCKELYEENKRLKERIKELEVENKALQVENKALQAENKALRDQLAKNSRNSSKPPSQDQAGAVKSTKKESNRPMGGQRGHTGQGGKLEEHPDTTLFYSLGDCPDCGQDLREVEVDEIIRKQIEDIPEIKTTVTEYQVEVKTCPGCRAQWQAGGCPAIHEFEYGPNVKALSVYLSTYQFIPQKRIKELLCIFGINLSTGTLNNFRKAAAKQIQPFIKELQQTIAKSPSAHFDETGIKVGKVNHWVHVASTLLLSFFGIYNKRGQQAHKEMDVLPKFSGIMHHDSYRPYNGYSESRSSLCCAHILRELQFAIERDNQQSWAQPMTELLLEIKKEVDESIHTIAELSSQHRYRKRYRKLIQQGLKMNPPAQRPDGQIKGATKQSKTYNLLVRLRDREDDILRFMSEPLAQFTNNQAERDLRMNKVRAKVSGGFRALKPAEEFMHIRSLISTAVKQSVCPLLTLKQVFSPGNNDFLHLANPD